jgi:hypothetical protein
MWFKIVLGICWGSEEESQVVKEKEKDAKGPML